MKKTMLTAVAVLAVATAPLAFAAPAGHNPMMTKCDKMCQHRMMMHRMWIMKVQRALDKAGAHLKVDGYWGPKTAAAVSAFQKSHGLKVTGHLDHETIVKLGLWHKWHKGWKKK